MLISLPFSPACIDVCHVLFMVQWYVYPYMNLFLDFLGFKFCDILSFSRGSYFDFRHPYQYQSLPVLPSLFFGFASLFVVPNSF